MRLENAGDMLPWPEVAYGTDKRVYLLRMMCVVINVDYIIAGVSDVKPAAHSTVRTNSTPYDFG